MTPDERLAAARAELATFYDTHVPTNQAIKAMHRLRELLGVELKRAPGVPEAMTVEVDYQVELSR